MLNKIYPEDVAKSWEVFAPLIAKSIPPALGGNVTTMTSILEAIMVETLDCWVLLGRNSDNQNMSAFATTHIVEDELTYIGGTAFSGTGVGEVRIVSATSFTSNDITVYVDSNGDGIANGEFDVHKSSSFAWYSADDFIL